jgi:hypothetical protein
VHRSASRVSRCCRRALYDLIFQSRDRDRSLASAFLLDIDSSQRMRPVALGSKLLMQQFDPFPRLVLRVGKIVHSRTGVLPQPGQNCTPAFFKPRAPGTVGVRPRLVWIDSKDQRRRSRLESESLAGFNQPAVHSTIKDVNLSLASTDTIESAIIRKY